MLDRGGVGYVVLAGLAIAMAVGTGCQTAPQGGPVAVVTQVPAPADSVAEAIRRDPLFFLRQVKTNCDAIPRYRMMFYRQERLGLFGSLTRMEKIAVQFRAEPFSVKFTWPDADSDYRESIYVVGANDGKLIVRERRGWLGLPPTTRRIDPMEAVKWGGSKRPITDFGLSRMMERTLATIDEPPLGEPARIRYAGIDELEPTGTMAHHFVILRATTKASPCPRQDLWIDVETVLPAGSSLVLPDGKIDALYLYADVQADDSLSDEDFQLSVDQAEAKDDADRTGRSG